MGPQNTIVVGICDPFNNLNSQWCLGTCFQWKSGVHLPSPDVLPFDRVLKGMFIQYGSMNQMQQEKELTENILKVVSRGSVRS